MSKAFSTGIAVTTDPSPSLSANQELPYSAVWSRLGARVLVTDYIGLGTPGLHTYANRIEQAHACSTAHSSAEPSDSPSTAYWPAIPIYRKRSTG